MENIERISDIGSTYGSLLIGTYNGKFYWIIEDYDTDLNSVGEWTEISELLYNTILTEIIYKK
ncbi:hypothetical protein J2O09_05640 [Elizabethkingia anophelis]|uniref:hypothetical protein n=1 Tax=Elizabethkingia anophelis TaxID=1117645 RepID=UPI0020B812B9|nr:hypothetical protein [Elizabethkingia anophelis]UTG62438.1 hypothetical protein J2O09_05640 [Elizabethkingia anophelis]UXM68722.1 hypothetical protein N7E57_05655 [Elizabethkingia anophelis]